MSLAIEQPQPVPLDAYHDGTIRVRGTRITLDTVVEAFRRGATAEEITQQYPTLSLADVYSVLAYFLRHEQEVTVYLAHRAAARGAVRSDTGFRFTHLPPRTSGQQKEVGLAERVLQNVGLGRTRSTSS